MSQKQKPNLAAALAEAGGATRRRAPAPLRASTAPARRAKKRASNEAAAAGNGVYEAPSRVGLKPITTHFPQQVRDQLKILAVEQGSTLHNLMAQAINDLFAKFGKPEIAPQQRPE